MPQVLVKGTVQELKFPNKGKLVPTEILSAGISIEERHRLAETLLAESPVYECKNVLPQQVWSAIVRVGGKGGSSKNKAKLVELLEPAPYEIPSLCPHYPDCGGCCYQTVPVERQRILKENQVKTLFQEAGLGFLLDRFEPILPGGPSEAYRNKMEFSFGDSFKGGPLTLGMHKKGSFHDIISVPRCRLIHPDMGRILEETERFFQDKDIPYYSTYRHEGVLRHLILRRSFRDQAYLINLESVTLPESSGFAALLEEWKEALLALPLEGRISGILYTENNAVADISRPDKIHVLFGQDHLTETLLGLDFQISPYSFFQTNTLGAETLYQILMDMAVDMRGKTVFDLYCGTGTIAQIAAKGGAWEVFGIELVEEAVEAARTNAALNHLYNCHFIAGDVLKEMERLSGKPDLVILDPPRDGVHPKALPKLLAFHPESFIYVSCKSTSLVRDLPAFLQAGYEVRQIRCCEMFANTGHIETVVALSHQNAQ